MFLNASLLTVVCWCEACAVVGVCECFGVSEFRAKSEVKSRWPRVSEARMQVTSEVI